ncbi:MAG: hypothetical protein ED559_12620 [Phycisphaera sp.]|nr:MAG: hypothetical protein ED559_12620 [Phycisphaera sp.]
MSRFSLAVLVLYVALIPVACGSGGFGSDTTLIETGNEATEVLAVLRNGALVVVFEPGEELSEIKFIRND